MRWLLLAALTASVLSGHARAQDRSPPPVPIEDWSLDTVSALGQELYIQDTAAWVATDALLETLTEAEEATIRGWVVLGAGPERTVRFLKAEGDAVVPGWDITVTNGQAAPPAPAADAELTGESLIRHTARQTAVANIGTLRCGRYNAVVARDPEGDGWLVWLLAGSPAQGIMPVGGHYRFRISADGKSLIRRDQLSNGCLNMDANPPPGPQGQPAGIVVSHIVSGAPVETHVFLSLQYRKPVYVSAGAKLFAVAGRRIREVDTRR